MIYPNYKLPVKILDTYGFVPNNQPGLVNRDAMK